LQDVITSISVFLAASGVIFAIVYYFFDLRNRRKVRKSDTFMRLFTHLNNEEFHKADMLLQYAEFSDYADFQKRYGPFSDQQPIHRAIRMVSFYFEAIGMLMYRKLVDEQMVWDVFTIKHRWEKVESLVKQLRKELNDPRYMEWFEYLYNWYIKQVKNRRARQQPIYLLES
jgi:hypothetical protein